MNYVFSVSEKDIPALYEYYQDYQTPLTKEHILAFFQAPEVTVTVFRSGKVMLQGENAYEDYLLWSELLGFVPEPQKTIPSSPSPKPVSLFKQESTIGSDEVGTGDFFGPVVVVAAFVEKKDIEDLLRLGIQDSKKIADDKIMDLGPKLETKLSHSVLVVPPAKFNDLTRKGYNMNKIKSYLHNHAIKKLVSRHENAFSRVIIDEFCSADNYFAYLEGETVFRKLTFVQKAEDQFPSVAAASIIARYTFLKEMEKLNQSLGIVVPLGASAAVDLIGKRIALEKGLGIFDEIAKTNFKNMDRIREMVR